MQAQDAPSIDPQDSCQLLQRTDGNLHRLLQVMQENLDERSLACMAVTCSRFSNAVPAVVRKLEAHCSSAESLQGFDSWVLKHRDSLTDITHCSIAGTSEFRFGVAGLFQSRLEQPPGGVVPSVPAERRKVGSMLRELRLGYCNLQPGVLQGCSGLTALTLEQCGVQDAPAAAAAIAALPVLQSLRVACPEDPQGSPLRAMDCSFLSVLQQLTNLSLAFAPETWEGSYPRVQVAELSQLSGLTNLQHLELTALAEGVPGGLPSQLAKLTCLAADFGRLLYSSPVAEQLQHLGSFTALQQLSVTGMFLESGHLSGLQHLSQLTGLKLVAIGPDSLKFSPTSTGSWACLTSLQLQESCFMWV